MHTDDESNCYVYYFSFLLAFVIYYTEIMGCSPNKWGLC